MSPGFSSLFAVCLSGTDSFARAGVPVYPNPVSGELFVESANEAQVPVFDATGRRVTDRLLIPAEGTTRIHVPAWPAGIHVVETGNGTRAVHGLENCEITYEPLNDDFLN